MEVKILGGKTLKITKIKQAFEKCINIIECEALINKLNNDISMQQYTFRIFDGKVHVYNRNELILIVLQKSKL